MLLNGTRVRILDEDSGFMNEIGIVVGIASISPSNRIVTYIIRFNDRKFDNEYPYECTCIREVALEILDE